MTFQVILAPLASRDLIAIERWITEAANRETALAYTDRIRDRLAKLQDYPGQGTPRPDLGLHVRTVVFEREIIIAYRILGDIVRIDRVVSGRRNDWVIQ